MQGYGPFNLHSNRTNNAPLPTLQNIDAQAAALEIINDGPFDQWIFLGPDSPKPNTAPSAYMNVVRAWDSKAFRIPKEGPPLFDGTVYLLTVDPGSYPPAIITPGLANNWDGRNNLYLIAYRVGEEPLTFSSNVKALDQITQWRIINVPYAYVFLTHWFNGAFNIPAAGASVNLVAPVSLVGLNVANAVMPIYLGEVLISWGINGAGAGGIDFAIQLDVQNAANVSIGGTWPATIYRYETDWQATAGPYRPFQSPAHHPIAVPIVFNPVTPMDHYAVVFQNIASSNPPTQARFTLATWADTASWNTFSVAQIPEPIGTDFLGKTF